MESSVFLGKWPKTITKQTKHGEWAWAIQNRNDGHCMYDVTVHKRPDGKVQAVGISEQEKYGKGSDEEITKLYADETEFMAEWGLK